MSEQRKLQRIKAGYLPGLNDEEVQWQTLDFGSRDGQLLEVSVPVLTAPQMQALACRVRKAAAAHLRPLPVVEGGRLLGLLTIGDLVKETLAEQDGLIQHLEQYIRGV